MTQDELRDQFVWYAERFIGKPYIWGGDDAVLGFDCSGLVCECLKSIGKIGRDADFTAAGLYNHFITNQIAAPKRAALVFYAAKPGGPIIHVEICRNELQSIGASGGGSKTLTVQDAIDQNAFIKVRTILSRQFIVGYVDVCL